MKAFNENKYMVRIAFAIVIGIICVGAFCFGSGRDAIPTAADKEEAYREYTAKVLEERLTASRVILSCDVDFEVDDNAVTKVYLTLDCAELLTTETEDNIKDNVAGAMNLSAEDIFISY
ncbi:MAG: hypothetical protein NC517_07495 [Firmicutes bacterium]|nr:hypothetical protein [Bacillota bacterium]